MARPLSIVGVVVLALLSLILSSIGSAYEGNNSTDAAFLFVHNQIITVYHAMTILEPKREWLSTLASLITIWFVLQKVWLFFKFVVFSMFRRGILEGTWHSYHFTRMGNKTILRYEEWKIRRDWQNRLSIKTNDPNDPLLKYRGFISKEKNHLIIILKGLEHEEEVQMRFSSIIPTGKDISYGLAMGVDFNGKPQCLVRIMSREKLTNENARRLLESKTSLKSHGILGIREECESLEESMNETVPMITSQDNDIKGYRISTMA
jgi:hypothetical protein